MFCTTLLLAFREIRRHILRKLNLKSTQEIAYYAIRGGLVDWPQAT